MVCLVVLLINVLSVIYSNGLPANTNSKTDLIRNQLETSSIKPIVNEEILKRVKRQYLKPNLDGIVAANERMKVLKSKSAQFTGAPKSMNEKVHSSQANNPNATQNSPETKQELTVTSLTLSLINLFDRLKCNLLKLIDRDCDYAF
jgi:hypothetical protein